MAYFDAFKALVDLEITTKTAPASIDPADTGTRFKELCDLIETPLFDITSITGGDTAPSGGNDGDVYLQGGINPVKVYQKISGTWTETGELSLVNGSVVNPTTTELTSTQLDAAYPTAGEGFQVIADQITDNPLIYIKGSSTWYSIPLGTIAP